MQTQAYFDDIQLQILHEIRKATTSIHIAVAWFTDPEILAQLYQLAGSGVRVEIHSCNNHSSLCQDQQTHGHSVFRFL